MSIMPSNEFDDFGILREIGRCLFLCRGDAGRTKVTFSRARCGGKNLPGSCFLAGQQSGNAGTYWVYTAFKPIESAIEVLAEQNGEAWR